jgi:RNA polymerase sigma-70 factor (ECF subfamily)
VDDTAEKLTNLSDEDLLRRMLFGDEEAFVALYRRRQQGIYRFALHMSGSHAVAEDVTQEVFLVLIKSGARYDASRGSVQAFLYGIARNCVKRHQERGGVHVPIDAATRTQIEDWPGRIPRTEAIQLTAPDNPFATLTHSEQIESVRQAVLSLPLPYREAVVLCELQEMSYAEAAAAAGCSVGTIRSRLHRARAILTKKLESQLAGFRTRPVVSGRSAPKRCPA